MANTLIHGQARIVNKYDKPHGIRDDGGYLIFFTRISKYPNQEERYKREIDQQKELANVLLAALTSSPK